MVYGNWIEKIVAGAVKCLLNSNANAYIKRLKTDFILHKTISSSRCWLLKPDTKELYDAPFADM